MVLKILPFLGWFEGYSTKDLRADLIAGLTVALVLIPQSMAYAQLAGLPAYYGLYAAFLPPMVASLFGSSRQLATGPVAVVSLMTAATLEPLAAAGSEGYILYAVFLALLVGIFQLTLGVLRLGVVVNFLSHPVVIGFTNAAAIIIATSQLSKIFGVSVDKAAHHYETIWRVALAAWDFTHWPTFFLGALAFGIMYGTKRINPRLPAVLLAVVVTTLISWLMGLEEQRSIALQDIKMPGLEKQIDRYNSDIQDIRLMSEARTVLGPEVEQLAHKQLGLCASCHANHKVEPEMLRQEKPNPSIPTTDVRSALKLHAKAGLLDQQIVQLKKLLTDYRTQLRSFKFEAVESGDKLVFYAQKQVPQGLTTDGHIWRLRVGNGTLEKTALVVMGGGNVVGAIPEGLPKLDLPRWDWSVFGKLIVASIIISILGFMEAISIAKAMAARTGQRLDPNQELIGQGLANIIGSFGQSYAVSGSFSRSAVNIQAGAVSGMSSVITSVMVVVVLLFLTPLLYHLPQSVLAAVIMMAVVGLINVRGIVHAWRVQKQDGIISVVTFVSTLLFAPHLDRGILIGVLLSISVFLYRKMKPAIAELSLARDGHLRSASHNRLKLCKHICVIRFEGPLFFANTSYLEDEVLNRLRDMPKLKAFVFACRGVNELDASAEEALSLLIGRLRTAGYEVYFAELSERIVEVMQRSHLLEKIGDDHIFPTSALAVEAIWKSTHQDSDERYCPLTKVIPLVGEMEGYRIKVLMIDDEKDFVKYTVRRLEKRNMEVDAKYDGESAVKTLTEGEYDVALLDMKMPGMDGTQALAEIRKRDPHLPIIVLTGHGTVETAVKTMRMGALEYLQKPCEIEELVSKIHEIHRSQ